MDAAMVPEQGQTYMRGKRGNWFWPSFGMMAGLFVLVVTARFVYDYIFSRMQGVNTALILGLAVLYTAIHAAVWIIVPLAYGLNNDVKTFKVFFIIRASIQVPYIIFYFLTSVGMAYVFPVLYEGPAVYNIYEAFFYGVTLYWVAFMIAVSCHKKTGKTLRGWAIVAAVIYFLHFLYNFFYEWIYQSLYNVNEALAALMNNFFISLLINFLYMAPIIVILWAMSYTRPKENPAIKKAA
jgi:hypothetical protein